MENPSRYSRSSHLSASIRQRRNGYEPSDTENDWQDSPWLEHKTDNHLKVGAIVADRTKTPVRNISPLNRKERYVANLDYEFGAPVTALDSKVSPLRRRKSKSPYKTHADDVDVVISSKSGSSNLQRNVSPLSKSERRRHVSPHTTKVKETNNVDKEDFTRSNRKLDHKMSRNQIDWEENGSRSKFHEVSRVSEKSSYSHRSVSAPKPRAREKQLHINSSKKERRGDRSLSPLPRSLSRRHEETTGDINEIIANAKQSNRPISNTLKVEVTESMPPGDIFFSRDTRAMALNKKVVKEDVGFGNGFPPKPEELPRRNTNTHQLVRGNSKHNHNSHGVSSSTITSRRKTTPGSAISRQTSSRISTESSKMSDRSGLSSGSFWKFTANMQNSPKDTWFGCVRKGPCTTSKETDMKEFDEASFIEKAFVVENIRKFWADKHSPGSLSGFICHKQQAQHLKQLIAYNSCPHILFKGPSGSGKKALTMALLSDIFGDETWNISHDLRSFHVQEKRPMQITVPVTSSTHHVELHLKSETYARSALMAIVKEISSTHAVAPEISTAGFLSDYKVIVLYNAEKLAENVQHLIKWIMDCHTEACKIILCCEDDADILDSVKNKCKSITVDAPITHEIMEVLIQIARKENIDLSMNFAAKIATRSKQNLRKAIMALEACKTHNYPFADEQPIPVGWEEGLVELAAEILSDPSTTRLFSVREKVQKLLMDFVHPKLILQKLVEQFLKEVETGIKREIYYWHAYYEKRLPSGTSALLKLEEFVAKFMSIYRKSFRGHHTYPQ